MTPPPARVIAVSNSTSAKTTNSTDTRHGENKPQRQSHASASKEIAKLRAAVEVLGGEGEESLAEGVPFERYPLSDATKRGLKRGNFLEPTPIQRQTIIHGLKGCDVLGAAKTGSGKTLAYLVPMLEDLYKERVCRSDPLSGVVISPTRELAMQIFEVLKVVAMAHVGSLKMGTLVGGFEYAMERNFAPTLQVAICTPGRLLQHLEQTPGFDAQFVRVLVLDEADRLLDLGFSEQLKSILSYVPPPRLEGGTRQTMLFSATLPRSVKDLATFSLRDPVYVSVDEAARHATPLGLKQAYLEVTLDKKLDTVWSFIRTHLKNKTIVFFATCKQVRFVDAAFRRLRPGVSVLALHGKMKPARRMAIYRDFTRRDECVLLSTDIAARGLDFPGVDWVLQADCPDDVESYIHRVGRTARYKSGGHALLLTLPSETTSFLAHLASRRVPVKRLGLNAEKQASIQAKLRALLAEDTELKTFAQKAFKSYLRSVHLQGDKEVFRLRELPVVSFAGSLGLASAPRVRFLKSEAGEEGRRRLRESKNVSRQLQAMMRDAGGSEDEEETSSSSSSEEEDGDESRADVEVMRKRKRETALAAGVPSQYAKLLGRRAVPTGALLPDRLTKEEEEEEEDDDLLRPVGKKTHERAEERDETRKEATTTTSPATKSKKSKKSEKLRLSLAGTVKGAPTTKRVVFDEEGEPARAEDFFSAASSVTRAETLAKKSEDFVERAAKRLKAVDEEDRRNERDRIKQKHAEIRAKRKAEDAANNRSRRSDELPESSEEEDDDDDTEERALRLIETGRKL